MEDSLKLNQEDIQIILSTVKYYKENQMDPLLQRPEVVLSNDQLSSLIKQGIEAGIISTDMEKGFGLWESVEEPFGLQASLNILSSLAESNAGIAFALNGLALAKFLRLELNFQTDKILFPLLQGRNGLARFSLAKLLFDISLSEEDHLFLKEFFPIIHTQPYPIQLLQSPSIVEEILYPTYNPDDQTIHWAVVSKDHLQLTRIEHYHGIEEVPLYQIIIPNELYIANLKMDDKAASLSLFRKVMGLNALAMIAIALGSLRKAYHLSKEYALTRKQGGIPIIDHPAIRELIGNIASVLSTTESTLKGISFPSKPSDFAHCLKARAVLHPLICQSVNHALQILGGYGYMRDYGLEKIVRDNNQLKLSFGTPGDILLFLSVKERDP
jgi:acyl-CoA dehydrogenase